MPPSAARRNRWCALQDLQLFDDFHLVFPKTDGWSTESIESEPVPAGSGIVSEEEDCLGRPMHER